MDDELLGCKQYCSKACLRDDRSSHREACKQIQGLRRAASLFSEIYLDFLRHTFPDDLKSIQEDLEGSMITIRLTSPYRRCYLGLPLFRTFPSGVAASPEQEQAILCSSGGMNVIDTFPLLVDLVFRRESVSDVEYLRSDG